MGKNLYLVHLDYELEIEFQESVGSRAHEIIAQIANSFLTTYETKGKRRRFFDQFHVLKLGLG
ncbi:hypothetical protein GCM10025859_66410 [Alicyclobacillus fastidiosus]|nr:hypothetical protein GCM10025859_64210 [Alicyclobacillus fastidiosus]GMA66199.1 hypothetical protein GCM10025859_66410 [Alicyclobacillus fastidiosus]